MDKILWDNFFKKLVFISLEAQSYVILFLVKLPLKNDWRLESKQNREWWEEAWNFRKESI